VTQPFWAGPASEPAGGRRRTFIEDARRAQIVNATVTVIADVGYVNATLAKIAAAAGIAKGLVSYHFRDKDELMEQTMLVVHARVSSEVVGGIDQSAPAPDVLRAIIQRVAAYGAEHGAEIRTLNQIAQNLRRADGQLRFTLADNEEIYKTGEQLYRRGQHEGYFRQFDTRVMAVTFQAALDAMFAYAEAYPETDLLAYADGLADLMLSAVSKGGST
jgi:AcrR family transcriptional regulator